MKRIGVLVLLLFVVFFSTVSTFAEDFGKADVLIGSENTSATQTNQRDVHTVSTSETLAIDDEEKTIDVTLSLKTKEPKTTAVDTGDATPVLLLIALMSVSGVAAIILIRRKKLGKVMAMLLSVAMLLTGFISNPGTAQALSFSKSNVEIDFTKEILEAFEFDQIVSISGGTHILKENDGQITGITWELGNSAKNKSQELVYRLKMRDTVSEDIFGKSMNIAETAFTIGKGVGPVSFAKTNIKLGLDGYELIYDANGGDSTTVPAAKMKLEGTYPLSDSKPKHAKASDGTAIVFAGWTAARDTKIYAMTDTEPATIIEATIVDAAVTVYAVWGYDTDNNGVADINQTRYNLIYDVNGGKADGPASEKRIPGTYTLSSTKPTHAADAGKKIVFVGWTAAKDTKIYVMTDTAPATITQATIGSADVTVYAAWGYDEDGDGVADVIQTKYKLIYDVNGGKADGPASENRIPGTYQLSTTKPTHAANAGGTAIVFVGWTAAKDTKIYAMTDTAPATITQVTIGSANVTVYAVWGYDEDGNGKPDVLETKYKLIYDVNGGNANGPASENRIPGTYTLSTTKPTHAADAGKKIVFIGWTAAKDTKIYDMTDTAPATITQATIGSANVTVYAVWGYDEDGNGVPDVLQTKYKLIYDVNGGNTDGPASENRIPGTYTLSTTKPTHDDDSGGTAIVFVGWTAAKDTKIYAMTDTAPTTITQATMGSANVTVYAVWGYDVDNSGIPDILETKYRLIYDINGGNANGPASENRIPGTYSLSTTKPTHAAAGDGTKIVFVGWTAAKDTKIYEMTDTAPATITQATIGSADVTVYAVWGYDVDNSGIPDILETKYRLIYDVNDGNADGPASENRIPGTYTLSTTKPTHAAAGDGTKIVFVGWTAAKDTKIYDMTDTAPTTITSATIGSANVTVYAVWGYDADNSGVPDVLQTRYNLIYDVNGGNADGPATEKRIPGTYQLSTTKPTHAANAGGTKIAFVGWTAAKDTKIYAMTDTAPTTITDATIGSANVTVYAVWGYDEDNSGVPDILEGKHRLIYDVNGGNADGPVTENRITGTYTLSATKPTHAAAGDGTKIVFIGWTAAKDTKIYDMTDTAPTTTTSATIGSADVTVYAVWGYDVDNSGVPDVLQTKYSLTYSVNGGTSGTGPATKNRIPGIYNVSGGAAHGDVDSKKVILIGWTAAQDSKIYSQYDDASLLPERLTTVEITNDNVVIYALWGYDEDGNSVPDILQVKDDIIYNVNGGNADGPASESRVPGTYTLNTTKPTHEKIDGRDVVFVGWTTNSSVAGVYDAGSKAEVIALPLVTSVTMTDSDVTVYAVWSYAEGGVLIWDRFKVTFDTNGGSAEAAQYVLENGTATRPATDPTKADNTFLNWYGDSELTTVYNFATQITSNITIYARWDGAYKIEYDVNGGTDGPADDTGLLPGSYDLNDTTIPTHDKIGGRDVVFVGWTTNASVANVYDAGLKATVIALPLVDSVTINNNDVKVYAVWSYSEGGIPIWDRFKVTFNTGGGTQEAAQYVVENGYATRPTTDPTKTHNTFVDWCGDAALTTPYNFATTQITSNITIYAKWIGAYKIEYDENGGIDGPADKTGLLPGSHDLDSTTTPTHDDIGDRNVVFVGWTTNASVAGVYDAGSKATVIALPLVTSVTIDSSDIKVYAVWSYAEGGVLVWDRFKVTFNTNGGSAVAAQYVVENGTATRPATNPTKTDNTFVDWCGDAALTTSYNFSTQISSNITIYAKWDGAYKIEYDVNGGTDGPVDDTGLLPGSHDLDDVTIPMHGGDSGREVKFVGWTTNADAEGEIYDADSKATVTALPIVDSVTIENQDVTVYAVWSYAEGGILVWDKFKVTFNTNGGTTIAPQYIAENGTATRPATDPTKTHNTFVDWCEDSALTTSYNFSTPITSSITIYAKWTGAYKIMYDENGGNADGPADVTGLLPGQHTISGSATHATVDSKTVMFIGWTALKSTKIYSKSDAAISVPAAIGTVDIINADVTVWALWAYDENDNGVADVFDVKYTVTYDANWPGGATGTGSVPTDSNTYLSGAAVTVQANPSNLAKTGYVFLGWADANDATTPNYPVTGPGTYTMQTANKVLYGVWQAVYSVTYNSNGGTGTAPSDSNFYASGAAVTVLQSTLTRSGFTFIGWATSSSATTADYVWDGSAFTPATFAMGTGNVNLYAVWRENQYSVTYNANWPGGTAGTGSVPVDSNTYLSGATVTVKGNPNGLDKTNYVFLGWADVNNATTANYPVANPGTLIMPGANKVLYGVWATITSYVVDWQSYGSNYYTVKNLSSAPADDAAARGYDGVIAGVNRDFTHGSTDAVTQSRVWRATVTTTATETGSTWSIVNDGNDGAGIADGLAWQTATGTTNYLNIPANYSGTITVKVASILNPLWYTVFDIVVAPKPVIATGNRVLTNIQTGDGAWVEVATMEIDGSQYSLIVRGSRINNTTYAFGPSSNNYATSNIRTQINTWYNTLVSGNRRIVDFAVTNNVLQQLGTTYTQVNDGFSVPLGEMPESGSTDDVAFALSSGEAIEFCSQQYNSPSGTSINSTAQAAANWTLLGAGGYGFVNWLRSSGPVSTQASALGTGGQLASVNVTPTGCSILPAVWVKSDIFNVDPIVSVAVGYSHSFGIDSLGRLYGWGNNGSGRLGNGSTNNVSSPTSFSNISARFKSIAAGENHTLAIDTDGNVWAWGNGANGKLGQGNTTNYSSPRRVNFPGNPKFVEVDALENSSVALDEDGNIWTWGSPENGTLGNGTTSGNVTTPWKVTGFGGETPFFIDIDGGSYESSCVIAADSDGNVWAWGENNLWGQTGLVHLASSNVTTPTKVYTASTGRWTSTTSSNGTITHLAPGLKMVSVSVGWGLGGSMDENGSLYTWGANNCRELGLGISSGGTHYAPRCIYNALTGDWVASGSTDFGAPRKMVFYSMFAAGGLAIDELGNFYAWGNNDWGQVGVNNTTDVTSPTRIYNAATGQFIGGASTTAGTKMVMANGYRDTVLIVAENGAVFGCGRNGDRQVGNNSTTNRHTYVRVSSGLPS